MYPMPSGFYGKRLALIADAARLMRDAINEHGEQLCERAKRAGCNFVPEPADVATEYNTLRNDPDPFGYLDDLEARVGVDVARARALLVLAYRTPADEFPDHYWTLFTQGFFRE